MMKSIIYASLCLFSTSAVAVPTYRAMIGNHAAIEVHAFVDGSIELRRSFENSRIESYNWSPDLKRLEIKTDGTSQTLSAELGEPYRIGLRQLRDLLAYTVAPSRYDWLVFGTSVLNLELNSTIALIDTSLAASETGNCRFFIGKQMALSLTGGAIGELGTATEKIDSLWVREGYEAVLSNRLQLATEDAILLHARGEAETSEIPEMAVPLDDSAAIGGRMFTLFDTALAGTVRSLICRPILN